MYCIVNVRMIPFGKISYSRMLQGMSRLQHSNQVGPKYTALSMRDLPEILIESIAEISSTPESNEVTKEARLWNNNPKKFM